MKSTRYQIGVVSITGCHRARNEDAYAFPAWVRHSGTPQDERGYVYPRLPQSDTDDELFLVTDGVGGSEQGQAASVLASRTAAETYYALTEPARADLRLERTIRHTNETVHAFANASQQRASTTLVGLLCRDKRGFVANVGDSRAYQVAPDAITLLTQDHGAREEMVRSGEVSSEASLSIPASRISRSVGKYPDVTPDIFKIEIHPEDRFVLCTDGLTRHVHDEEILHHVNEGRTPQEAAQSLVNLAVQRGGKDNITVMVIQKARVLPPTIIYAVLRALAVIVLVMGLLWAGWLAYLQWKTSPRSKVNAQPFVHLSIPDHFPSLRVPLWGAAEKGRRRI